MAQAPYLALAIPGQVIAQIPGAINLDIDDISLDDILGLGVKGGIGAQTTVGKIAARLGLDSVFQTGLFVDMGNVGVPAEFDLVATSGFSRSGLGSAVYEETDTLPPFNGGFADKHGRFFKIINSDYGLSITQFGAIDDSNISFAPGADLTNQNYPFVPVGGTDNVAEIQNALDYVNYIGGGTVTVPATGVFGIANTIYPKNRTILRGLGGWLTRLQNSPLFHFIRIDDSSQVIVTGLNIDGNRAGQAIHTSVHLIRTHNSSDVTISWNWLYSTQGYTISSDIDIGNITIVFNRIYNSSADGIDFHNTGVENNGALVSYNIIDGWGYNGQPKAAIHGRGNGLEISYNIIKHCGGVIAGLSGIAMGNGENVAGQRCIGNYVENGPLNAAPFNNVAKGIVWNNPDTIISDNTVVGDTGTLSGYSGNLDGATITGNVVSPAQGKTVSVTGDGFNTGATMNNSSFTGNVADGCGQSGFADIATGNTYSNNKAKNCARYGFELNLSTGALLDSTNTQTNCTLGLIRRGTGTLLDQATDISSTPSFATVLLPNAPVNGTDATNKAYVDGLVASPFVAGQSGAASAVITGAGVETIVGTKTIPGGLLGLNGMMTVYYSGINTAGAASKIYRLRLGGIGGAVFSAFSNTVNTTVHGAIQFINANNAAIQKGQVSNSVAFGPSTSTPLTGAVNTAIDQDLVLTCQVTGGSVADTMFVDWYSMQLSRAPT